MGEAPATWRLAEGRGTERTRRGPVRGLPSPWRAHPFLPPGPSLAPQELADWLRVFGMAEAPSHRVAESALLRAKRLLFSLSLSQPPPPLKSQIQPVSGALGAAGRPNVSRADRKSRCYYGGQASPARSHTGPRAELPVG